MWQTSSFLVGLLLGPAVAKRCTKHFKSLKAGMQPSHANHVLLPEQGLGRVAVTNKHGSATGKGCGEWAEAGDACSATWRELTASGLNGDERLAGLVMLHAMMTLSACLPFPRTGPLLLPTQPSIGYAWVHAQHKKYFMSKKDASKELEMLSCNRSAEWSASANDFKGLLFLGLIRRALWLEFRGFGALTAACSLESVPPCRTHGCSTLRCGFGCKDHQVLDPARDIVGRPEFVTCPGFLNPKRPSRLVALAHDCCCSQ